MPKKKKQETEAQETASTPTPTKTRKTADSKRPKAKASAAASKERSKGSVSAIAKEKPAKKAPATTRAAKPKAKEPSIQEPESATEKAASRPSPKRPTRRKPAGAKATRERAPARTGAKSDEDLPIASWRVQAEVRPRGRSRTIPDKPAERDEPELTNLEDSVAVKFALRPAQFRRRGEPKKAQSSGPRSAVASVPEPEPKADAPHKPLIPIPPDAPQIVVRDGIPTLVRNGRVYPPFAFFGSAPDERRSQTVLEELRLASEAGVHLHFLLVEFEVDLSSVDSAVSLAAYLLAKSVETDPEAQVVFRLVFVAPKGWEERYSDAAYSDQTGRSAEPSVCDSEYWDVARRSLVEFVRRMRIAPSADHIVGIHLERGEWFSPEGVGYDSSPAATRGFREWARTRYLNDEVALRAAWFDGEATFDKLEVPEFHGHANEASKFIRVSRRERPWVDYHLFLSDATVHRISDLAYAVKEASEGRFLVGASYGYTFEWSHPSSGHLSLGKLLRTPEIDFIAGPPSYRSREPGGAAPFPSPIDSFPLNGKLYISEEDFKTSIGEYREPDDFNPVIKTPQALESVHWRGIGAALAHASGVCWMDLWGNGWLKTASIWDRGARARELLTQRMAAPFGPPDVAVFIDERALAYLVDETSFALLVQNVRESVLRSGLSAGFYLLSDLAHRETFPESKLYIFLNAWDMRPEHRAAIKGRLQRDGKVLFWLYCAGLFDTGRESLERAREVTGIALKPQPFHSKTGTTVLNRRDPLSEAFPDRGLIGGARLEPSYFAIPEDANVLGEYSQTGLPSFVVREFSDGEDPGKSWKSVFMGEPVVSPALVRALGQLAGAHIWNYQDDVVHVRPPFLAVHCTGSGSRTLMLPNQWSAYDLHSEDWVATDATNLRFQANDGGTHLFLVGLPEDVEACLSASHDDLLQMETLPERDENVARLDLAAMDVPIVKLDEWIEGGVPEEVSDEWLLRPKLIDEEEPEDEEPEREPEQAVGRRRRARRRSPRPDSGGEEFGDLRKQVLFRKRQ